MQPPLHVCLLGATGTIGRATLTALLARNHHVVCLTRHGRNPVPLPPGAEARPVDLQDPAAIARDGLGTTRFDAILSCMASRTGTPRDAWAVDHRAHLNVLDAAQAHGIPHFVLLSALCVQHPLLAFQHAKRAFEVALAYSGLSYAIVRPTAFFKSLSGQIDRVRRGKPYLLFGDGRLTACTPISDRNLAEYLVDCLTDPERRNRILPIGGPGPAITPRDQADALFALLGRPPHVRQVPVALLDAIIATLALAGRVLPALADKAELARIGRYYATQSMLVRDPATGQYDAAATPAFGTDTLFDYYRHLVHTGQTASRGDHAVF